MSGIDPRWPKVLSLTVHEFRTPLTVILGYLRMLLGSRTGPITDRQRELLENIEKSCARLVALTGELSELSDLEDGTLRFHKRPIDLRDAVRQAVTRLPPLPDREVRVELEIGDTPVRVNGDAVRLTQAFTSVIVGLRRELAGDLPLVIRDRSVPDGYEILIGDADTLRALESDVNLPLCWTFGARDPGTGGWVFDEWRGGVGLILANARRIIERHGGRLWGVAGGVKTGARITLPLS